MTNENPSTIDKKDIDRFMGYVRADDDTGAWAWAGGISSSGYGAFWYQGKTVGAHVFAYRIANGDIPDGMVVCHRNENLGRHNVNPAHLFLGTYTDNMQDAAVKMRTLSGARNKASKLTSADAILIVESDETYKVLSERFGVSQAMVSQIKRGCRWASVTGLKPTEKPFIRNQSGYTGVRWRERGKKWNASIGQSVDGKYVSTHLGGFETAEDAARAYDAAAIEMHGDKAKLNF